MSRFSLTAAPTRRDAIAVRSACARWGGALGLRTASTKNLTMFVVAGGEYAGVSTGYMLQSGTAAYAEAKFVSSSCRHRPRASESMAAAAGTGAAPQALHSTRTAVCRSTSCSVRGLPSRGLREGPPRRVMTHACVLLMLQKRGFNVCGQACLRSFHALCSNLVGRSHHTKESAAAFDTLNFRMWKTTKTSAMACRKSNRR